MSIKSFHLFKITVGPKVHSIPLFANIQTPSNHPAENEYLFSMDSIFRIESLSSDSGGVEYVQLSTTTDYVNLLMKVTDQFYVKNCVEDMVMMPRSGGARSRRLQECLKILRISFAKRNELE